MNHTAHYFVKYFFIQQFGLHLMWNKHISFWVQKTKIWTHEQQLQHQDSTLCSKELGIYSSRFFWLLAGNVTERKLTPWEKKGVEQMTAEVLPILRICISGILQNMLRQTFSVSLRAQHVAGFLTFLFF